MTSTITPAASKLYTGEFYRETGADGKVFIMFRKRLADGQYESRKATGAEAMNYLRTTPADETDKAPQCIIKATLEDGHIVVRIPDTIDPKHVQASSTFSSFIAKYGVELPPEALLCVNWPEGPTFHKMGGSRRALNVNVTLGLKDELSGVPAA